MTKKVNLEKEKLEDTEKKLETQLKRALADYDNLKKRFEKERSEVVKFANQALLLKLLNIVDGLDLALAQFAHLLSEEGVEEIIVEKGTQFDPHRMEAVSGEGEKVLEILQRGYKMQGRVIRPVRVKVSH